MVAVVAAKVLVCCRWMIRVSIYNNPVLAVLLYVVGVVLVLCFRRDCTFF